MMARAAEWAFWVALASLVYMYAGFPILVAAFGLWRRRTVRKAPMTPPMSLIIAAYNEEAAIAARLENALASDYPPDRLQIIVASDGSSDATDAIVGAFRSRGVVLLSLPRGGKIRALNEAVRHASGEILVFSDANTMCEPDALTVMAANFADPTVGGVAGHTVYRLHSQAESSSHGESLYWDYDTWLKELESQTGSVVSAHGGLHAVRRQLYRPVLDGGVTDDFAISTAVVEQGYRLVFEPRARAAEIAVPEATREFRRRVRLMTRGLRAILLRRRLLNPFRHGLYSVLLFSHKVVRRLAPVSLIAIAWATLWLAPGNGFYLVAALGQGMFYGLAVMGWFLRRGAKGRMKLLYVPFYYCMANAACAVALVQLALGKRIELWQPQRGEA
jgi:cellulose synthase/poly-beta-1,6-N-acetylglucosamine synthase-like glycosyltransferase